METQMVDKLMLITKFHFFTNAENKSCPNGWIAVNDLQPNEKILGSHQQPHFNPNKVRAGVKLLIPLSCCTDSVE